jgi:hypothetical protein
MKPAHHHVQRLAQRMLEAETCTDVKQASRIVKKAEKHKRKINLWRKLLASIGIDQF